MKTLLAFDLDDTLAPSKSAISSRIAQLLSQLLSHYQICIISGGDYIQFQKQVIDILDIEDSLLARLHLMPTCGTRYYRFLDQKWQLQYAEDLSQEEKIKIREVIEEEAKKMNLWEPQPFGNIIEDRLSQITFSALGQQAPTDKKYLWAQIHEIHRQELRDAIANRLPNLEVRIGGTTSIDITKIGIDKSYGMKKIMNELQILPENILFFGDNLDVGGNDYPVKTLGIDTIAVKGWETTAYALEGILQVTQ